MTCFCLKGYLWGVPAKVGNPTVRHALHPGRGPPSVEELQQQRAPLVGERRQLALGTSSGTGNLLAAKASAKKTYMHT